jgi:hypothetical protein
MTDRKPPTSEELEALLNSEDDRPVTIRPDGTIQEIHPRRQTEPVNKIAWPDPTPEMLHDPKFEAVWQLIKSWDINVPEAYGGYCHATGNHVRAILDALKGTETGG